MEIASITGALSGIKAATDIVKIIKDSGTSLADAEIKFKLADLLVALADAKIEIANFKEVLSEKDEEMLKLKASVKVEKNVEWKDPYYFLKQAEGEDQGPFCQRCYDVTKTLVRLQSPSKNGYWKCHECNKDYRDSSYKRQEI
jgi:hypothetical protein